VQQELNVRSSQLEALQAQLAAKKLLSDEELRVQALAEIEEVRQKDIQRLKDQIKYSLSEINFLFLSSFVTLHLIE